MGSSPTRIVIYASMAQRIAHRTSNPGVAGSNPAGGVLFLNFVFSFWVLPIFFFDVIILNLLNTRTKEIKVKVRHPGIEPGPPRWQRGIIATRLMALKRR